MGHRTERLQRVIDVIEKEPGITTRLLEQRLGMQRSSLQPALTECVSQDWIIKKGNFKEECHWYPTLPDLTRALTTQRWDANLVL